MTHDSCITVKIGTELFIVDALWKGYQSCSTCIWLYPADSAGLLGDPRRDNLSVGISELDVARDNLVSSGLGQRKRCKVVIEGGDGYDVVVASLRSDTAAYMTYKSRRFSDGLVGRCQPSNS